MGHFAIQDTDDMMHIIVGIMVEVYIRDHVSSDRLQRAGWLGSVPHHVANHVCRC